MKRKKIDNEKRRIEQTRYKMSMFIILFLVLIIFIFLILLFVFQDKSDELLGKIVDNIRMALILIVVSGSGYGAFRTLGKKYTKNLIKEVENEVSGEDKI